MATDTRIVQMRFDNRDFEKNIAVSQESLEKFKDELDFEEQEDNLRNFGDAVKNFGFDSMAENLQKLTDKFTGLGTITELVLSQIRRGIESAAASVTNFVNSLTFAQASEGKNKFDMLNKSVQTIKAATGLAESEVYDVMQRLNEYTDQTSYNFADMAQNIGKFTSVGINLKDAEMEMEGIANWAARSGAGINEASRAMYNLSQAMGVGSLKLMDWKSIENAGMATKEFKEQLIDTAIAAGTLVKTTDKKTGKEVIMTAKNLGKQVEVNFQNVSNTLNKGWASRQVIENTLKKYYWDDLYYQGTEALIKLDEEQKKIVENMFSDTDAAIDAKDWQSLENIGVVSKDVKKKLLDLAVSYGKVTKETDDNGKTIYKVLDKNKKEIAFTMEEFQKGLAAGWLDKNLWETATTVNEFAEECYEAAQKCLTFTDVIQAWKDQISTGFMNTYKHIFGELTESMELFSAICNKVGESFTAVTNALNGYKDEEGNWHAGIFGEWANMGGRDSLWSIFVGEYDGLYEGAVGILDIFKKVGDMIREGFWHMMFLIKPGNLTEEAWMENEDYRFQFIAESMLEISEKIEGFIQNIRNFMNEVPAGAAKSRGQMIQDVINGVLAAILLAYIIVKKVAGFFIGIIDQFGPSFDAILGLLSQLGLAISGTAQDAAQGKGLTSFFGNLLESIKPLTGAINRFIEIITKLLGEIIKKGTENGTFKKILDFLGKLLNLFVDIISRVASPLIDFVGDLMDAFSDLFSEGINQQSMTKFGKKLSAAIEKLFNGVLEGLFGADTGKKINEFFGYIFGFDDKDAMEGEATTAIGAIKMWFKKLFGLVGGLFDGLKNEDGEYSLFRLLKERLGIGSAVKFLKDINKIFAGSNIFKLLKTFGTLLTIFKAFKMLSAGKQMFGTIGEFFGGLSDSLKNGIKLDLTQKTETTGEKLLKIAEGIALIAAAVAVLGSMKISSLIKGVAVVGIIYLILSSLMKKMADNQIAIQNVAAIGLLGFALVGMIIGLTLLILALRPLAKMNIEQIASMLTGFAGIILILGLFARYVTTDTKNIKARDMFAIALMAIGIGILVKSLRPLANIKLTGLIKMGAGLTFILYMLSWFSKKMGTLKGTGMAQAILMAVSIGLLVRTLLPLADVEWENLLKMGAGLGFVLYVLSWFSKEMGSLKGTGMFQAIILAEAIRLLIKALLPLSDVSWENLGKMGAGLAGILLMLHMFNSGLGSYRFGEMAGVIAVAVSIWLIVKALLPLANVEWGSMAKMGAGLVGILLALYLFMEMAKGMKPREGAAGLVAMIGLAVVLLTFGFTMNLMSEVKWSTIVVSVIMLSILLLVYFGVVDLINSNEKTLMKGMHGLILMIGLAAVMLVFSMALNEIKSMKVDKILAFSLGLAALLIAMAIALEITSKLSLVGAIKGILILGVAIAAIMAVLSLIMPLVLGSIASSLENLGDKLAILGNMFAQFVANMSSFSEQEVESARRKFDILFDLVKSLSSASQYMKPLEDFTTMVRKLGAALNLYMTLTANVRDPDNDPAIKLVERICGLKDKINGFELGTFSDDLAVLGGAIATFNDPDGTGGITDDKPMAFKLLSNILDSKSQIEAFSKLDLTGFTERLQGLGGALTLYAMGAKEVTGLGNEQITEDGISGAVQIMTAISNSLNENGGFKIPDLPQEGDLKDFPSQLAALANAVILFANGCKEFDDGKAENGLKALGFLGELNTSLTEDNVKIANKTKDVKTSVMARFATNIRLLGGALFSFYDATKDIGDTSHALAALTFFKQLGTDLTEDAIKSTLLMESFGVTKDTLGTFSEDIVALGGALQSFANSTHFDADTTTTFDNAVKAIQELVKMQQEMPETGGVVQWFSGRRGDFEQLGRDIEGIGAGLVRMSNALSGHDINGKELEAFNSELVTSALNSIASFAEIIANLSTIPDDHIQGGVAYAQMLEEMIEELTNVTTFNGRENVGSAKLINNIVDLMHQVSSAIHYWNSQDSTIDMESINMFARFAEGLNLLVKSAASIKGGDYSFYDIGYNIAAGVANGIKSDESDLELVGAAKHMIKKIYDAAMAESKSASPSKLFRDTVGTYIALGVAKGISNNTDKPADAAEDLVNSTLYGAEGALGMLSRVINGELITNPTITPVLDLTNVETGMAQLNGWFGDKGLSLNGGSLTIDPSQATIFADTAMPKDYTENITRIGDEITSLREDIKTLGTAMKNIRLVMNTGQVVGAIGPEMDRYLGQRGFYSARTDI